MKNLFYIFILLIFNSISAQSVDEFFVASANHYINSQNQEALDKVNKGLSQFPENQKLSELKRKIEEQQNQEQQQGENEKGQDQNEETEQNPDDNDNQQESGQQDGRNQGEQGTGSSDENPLENEGEENSQNNQNQGERLQQQRYDNILKALETQEQNTQRRLMMGKSKAKSGRNQKDW